MSNLLRVGVAISGLLVAIALSCDRAEASCSRKSDLINIAFARVADSISTPDFEQRLRDSEYAGRALAAADAEDCMTIKAAINDRQYLAKLWLTDHYGYAIGPNYFLTPSSDAHHMTLPENMVAAENDQVADCRAYERINAFSTIGWEAGQIVAMRITAEPLHHTLKEMYLDLSRDLEVLVGEDLPSFNLSGNDWNKKLAEITKRATDKYQVDFGTLPSEPNCGVN